MTKKSLNVIGLGYVGLPIAVNAANAGFMVRGIDLDPKKIDQLKSYESYVSDVLATELKQALNTNLTVSKELNPESYEQIFLIAVPTPLDDQNRPDLSHLIDATIAVAKVLTKKSLVIVESTVQPGNCRDIVIPLLEKHSGYSSHEFFFVFSPERIDPSNQTYNLKNTPKLIAGLTPEATLIAQDFYSLFIEEVHICDSLEIAETAKLLENSFRLINISFINEISILCRKLEIDVNLVIKAASTKPYGFMPFFPSIGVGGHCIPVDPIYLSDKGKEVGVPIKIIELADKINREMPEYFAGIALEILGALVDKKVLVIGIAYKSNVNDLRESPAIKLIQILRHKGAKVFWHDDLVGEWNHEKSTPLSSDFDLAILATPHDYINIGKIESTPLLNTRNSFK
jgi:UDP-N-acetyl-D-glucosamine dehydrogenase